MKLKRPFYHPICRERNLRQLKTHGGFLEEDPVKTYPRRMLIRTGNEFKAYALQPGLLLVQFGKELKEIDAVASVEDLAERAHRLLLEQPMPERITMATPVYY